MKMPQYVSTEEVKRVCRDLRISDWTTKKESKVSLKEARLILKELNPKGMNIDLKEFCRGLEVELEHGIQFKDANVTNNHPLLTGLIVLAHFKESLAYYKRLANAKIALHKAELERLA